MNTYYLYLHVFPNNKRYVGITRQNPSRRWRNGMGYKTQILMYRAILKYGWDNIEHFILFSSLSKEEAETKEIEFITQFETNNTKYGYNIANGGNTNCVSEKTKQKISISAKKRAKEFGGAMLGHHHSEESKKMMSLAKQGANNYMFGNKITKEHKKAISIAQKGKIVSEETRIKLSKSLQGLLVGEKSPIYNKHPLSKKISQYTIDGTFIKTYISPADAERQTGIGYHAIRNNCIGKSNSSGGYRWKYE